METLAVDPLDVVVWGPVPAWDMYYPRSPHGWHPSMPTLRVVTSPESTPMQMSLTHLSTGIQLRGRTGRGGMPDGRDVADVEELERFLWDELEIQVAKWNERSGHLSVAGDEPLGRRISA